MEFFHWEEGSFSQAQTIKRFLFLFIFYKNVTNLRNETEHSLENTSVWNSVKQLKTATITSIG